MGSDISEALRRQVTVRARERCEYCLIHESDVGFPLQVDHIVSRKHGGLSTLENLAYACVLCNRRKGTDLATVRAGTGQIIRLFHPRQDLWAGHFQLEGARIRALSDVGAATADLLRFNTPDRLAERSLLQDLGRYPLNV